MIQKCYRYYKVILATTPHTTLPHAHHTFTHKKIKKYVSGRNERNNNNDDNTGGRRRRRRRARHQYCTLACLTSQSTSGSSPTYFLFPQNTDYLLVPACLRRNKLGRRSATASIVRSSWHPCQLQLSVVACEASLCNSTTCQRIHPKILMCTTKVCNN